MQHLTPHCISIDCRMLGMSGIGVYLENLVPEVIRQFPQYQFRLIGSSEKILSLSLAIDANITTYSCTAPIYSMQEQLAMSIATRGTDMLWVPHYNIPLMTGVPLMVTVHDVAHLVLPEVTQSFIRHSYAKVLFEGVRRRAKSIIAVSQFTADEFVRQVGNPHGTLTVVHNGVDTAWFEEPLPSEQKQSEAPTPYFIAVGNLKAHKRIDLLCRAFATIKDAVPHNLLLVGKHGGFISGGQPMQKLMDLAPRRIHCTGTIETPHLRALVRRAAALVFPSTYEGFGLPPLEAMAAGVPVLAADISPVREVCANAVFYVSPDSTQSLAQGLLAMAHMKAMDREKLVTKGRQQAHGFSWQAAAEKTSNIIRGVMQD